MEDFDWCRSLKSGDEWDYRFNDAPVCPHCGHRKEAQEFECGWLFEEGSHELTCENCGFDFHVSTNVFFKFSTHKQDPE